MDIYDQIFADLLGILPVQEWPDTRRLLQRAFGGRPPQWQLPGLTCQAIGAPSEQARPAIAALACMQISIIVIDDLLDDDTRGEHHQIGAPAAANIACAFQAAGLEAIARSEIDAKNKAAIMTILNQMILKTAFGQYMDVQVPNDEAAYWQIVQTKSSPYFGSAIQIGALYAGAAMDVADQLRRFGDLYGEMIQIHDDLTDTMAVPAGPDWIQKRATLPILFAELVGHPAQHRFLELRESSLDPDQLEEAQQILVRCGAVSYCFHQLFERFHEAKKILDAIPLQNRETLQVLLDRLIEPLLNLFLTLGWDYSGLFSSFEISRVTISGGRKPN